MISDVLAIGRPRRLKIPPEVLLHKEGGGPPPSVAVYTFNPSFRIL